MTISPIDRPHTTTGHPRYDCTTILHHATGPSRAHADDFLVAQARAHTTYECHTANRPPPPYSQQPSMRPPYYSYNPHISTRPAHCRPDPVVPAAATRLLQKFHVGCPSKYIRNPQVDAWAGVRPRLRASDCETAHACAWPLRIYVLGIRCCVYASNLRFMI